jgi:hypothetical protein
MNVEREYVNSLVNNPTTCSIVGKEAQDPSTTTKNIHGNLFPIYSYPTVWFSSSFMGCSLVISMGRKFQGAN